jgi:hypothetical protein
MQDAIAVQTSFMLQQQQLCVLADVFSLLH